MLHQKKKKLYFSLVLIYTVSNQLPQKVFFNENSGCIFRLEQNATCNPQLSRFSRYGNPIAWDCRILFMDIFEVNNI